MAQTRCFEHSVFCCFERFRILDSAFGIPTPEGWQL